MTYSLLPQLSESKLIPSKPSLQKWDEDDLRTVAYLYFLATRILLSHADTKVWAHAYIKRTINANNFDTWRSDGNDFYVLLYALTSDDDFKSVKGVSLPAVRDWMHHTSDNELAPHSQRLFHRLDGMFHISNGDLRSIRRVIAHWESADQRERNEVLSKVIQKLTHLAAHSELLPKLKSISKDITESASSGATSVASVATVVGGLGAGFAPDDQWRSVYGSTKPIVISRKKKKS